MTLLEEIQSRADVIALSPDTHAMAGALSVDRTALKSNWCTDRGIVAAAVAVTGDTSLSDTILLKLDAMEEQSRSAKAMIGRLFTDPHGLDFGEPGLQAWFDAVHAQGGFTDQERDVLQGLGYAPVIVSEFEVRCAIYNDDGTLRI